MGTHGSTNVRIGYWGGGDPIGNPSGNTRSRRRNAQGIQRGARQMYGESKGKRVTEELHD